MDPAVFLDRDNTIIRNDGDLGDPDQVELLQGAASAIASLCGLGFKIVVVSNQGGVARGKYTEEDVDRVHERIHNMIAAQCTGARIDRFYFCPYHPDATVMRYKREHPWRKPQPGMILQAAEDMGLDLARSWMIGDQMRDIEAGEAAGVRTILLRADAEQLQPLDVEALSGTHPEGGRAEAGGKKFRGPRYIARNLIGAVRIVAQKRNALDEPDSPAPDIPATPAPMRKWDAAAVAKLQRRPESQPATPSDPLVIAPAAPRQARPFRPMTTQATHAETPVVHPFRKVLKSPADDGAKTELDQSTPAAPTVTSPASHSQPDDDTVEGDSSSQSVSNQLATLRQILQELRNQRDVHGQFNSASIIVIVMLVVSIVCYLAALMLVDAADPILFFKLSITTIVILLSSLVVLLMRR